MGWNGTSTVPEGEEEMEAHHIEPALTSIRTLMTAVFCSVLASTMVWYCYAMYAVATEYSVMPIKSSLPGMEIDLRSLPYALLGRVVGAIIFDHMGDRLCVRVATASPLLLVASTTIAMGCLSSRVKGPNLTGWATLRFLQGVGVGGQWAGTILIPMSMCRTDMGRALASSLVVAGHGLGMAAAEGGALFMIVHRDLKWDWSWRIPFLVPVMLIPVAAWILFAGPRWKEHQRYAILTGQKLPFMEVVVYHFKTSVQGVLLLAVEALGLAISQSSWSRVLPRGPATTTALVATLLLVSSLIKAGFTIVSGASTERYFATNSFYACCALMSGAAYAMWFYLIVQWGSQGAALTFGYVCCLGPAIGLLQGILPCILHSRLQETDRHTGMGLLYNSTHLLIIATFPSLVHATLAAGRGACVRKADQSGGAAVLLVLYAVVVAAVSAIVAIFFDSYLPIPKFTRSPMINENILMSISRGQSVSSEGVQLPSVSRFCTRSISTEEQAPEVPKPKPRPRRSISEGPI